MELLSLLFMLGMLDRLGLVIYCGVLRASSEHLWHLVIELVCLYGQSLSFGLYEIFVPW